MHTRRAAIWTAVGTLGMMQVMAAVRPTSPDSSSVFRVGGTCTTQWNLDTTGTWTSFAIDLMSGGNLAMTVLTRVADDMDGTSGEGVFNFPCPAVTPNSAIYFLQFTQNGGEATWTNRFTIAGRDGSTTPPEFSTQPNGDAVPWGNGVLADGTRPSSVSGVSMPASASASVSASSGMITSTTSASSTIPTSPPAGSYTPSSASSSAGPSSASDSASVTDSSESASSVSASSSAPSSSSVPVSSPKSMFYDDWSLGAKIGLLAGVIVGGLLILGLLIWLLIRLCRRKSSDDDHAYGGHGGGRNLLGASTNSRENDDDAFDFRDEADSSYLKAIDNDSYASLHAEKEQQHQQRYASHHDYDPYTEKRQSAFVAPTDNRAGMGSGAARKLWAARQANAAAHTGGYAAATGTTPTLDYRAESPSANRSRGGGGDGGAGAGGVARVEGEAYPLVPMHHHVDAARSPSPANAYGYADLVPKAVHEPSRAPAPSSDYQWSADARGQELDQQSDWLRSRLKGK